MSCTRQVLGAGHVVEGLLLMGRAWLLFFKNLLEAGVRTPLAPLGTLVCESGQEHGNWSSGVQGQSCQVTPRGTGLQGLLTISALWPWHQPHMALGPWGENLGAR
jgi:hypothetical protein